MKLKNIILAGDCEGVTNILREDRQAFNERDEQGNTVWCIAARSSQVNMLETLFRFSKNGIFTSNYAGLAPPIIAKDAGFEQTAHFFQPSNLIRLYLINEDIDEVSWNTLLHCLAGCGQGALSEALNSVITLRNKTVHLLGYLGNARYDINVLKSTLKYYSAYIQLTKAQFNEIYALASDYSKQLLREYEGKLLNNQSHLVAMEDEDDETFVASKSSLETPASSSSLLPAQNEDNELDEKFPLNPMVDDNPFGAFEALAFDPFLESSQSSSSSVKRQQPSDPEVKIDDTVTKKQKSKSSILDQPFPQLLEMKADEVDLRISSISWNHDPIQFNHFPLANFNFLQNRNLALINAVRDPKKVAQLIRAGALPTQRNRENHTVLSLAVKWGCLETFEVVFQPVNKDFFAQQTYGPYHSSLMMIALKALDTGSVSVRAFANKQKNLLQIIDKLVTANALYADVNLYNLEFSVIERVLAIALSHNSRGVVNFFVSKRLFPHRWISEEYGPLIHLVNLNLEDPRTREILILLVSQDADINAVDGKGRTIAHKIFDNVGNTIKCKNKNNPKKFTNLDGMTDLLKQLLKMGSTVSCKDQKHRTVLMAALEVVVILKEAPSLGWFPGKPLQISGMEPLLEMVEILIEADPGYQNINKALLGPKKLDQILEIALDIAISGNDKLLRFIAEDPNPWTNREGDPWVYSIIDNHNKDFQKLLDFAFKYADINQVNAEGETLLHKVVSKRRSTYPTSNAKDKLTKYLLENGADVTIRSRAGHTVFHTALEKLIRNVNIDAAHTLSDITLCRTLIVPEVVFLLPPEHDYYALNEELKSLDKEFNYDSNRSKAAQLLQTQVQCFEIGLLQGLLLQYFVVASIPHYDIAVLDVINECLFGKDGTEKAMRETYRNGKLLRILRNVFCENRTEKVLKSIAKHTKLVVFFRGLLGESWEQDLINNIFDEENFEYHTLLQALFGKDRSDDIRERVSKEEKLVELLQSLFGPEWRQIAVYDIPAGVNKYKEEIHKAVKVGREVWSRQHPIFKPLPLPNALEHKPGDAKSSGQVRMIQMEVEQNSVQTAGCTPGGN